MPSLPIRRTGVVLAGGRSTRMGRCKALLELGGETLLVRVGARVARACEELVVVGAPRESVAAADLAGLEAALARLGAACAPRDVRLVHDAVAHRGPVAGLAAGLAAARGELAFVTACDVPFLDPALVAALLAVAAADPALDAVVPQPLGRWEPLAAVYRSATMASHFARQLADGDLVPTERFAVLHVRALDDAALAALGATPDSFANLNDPVAYRAAVARLAVGVREA